MSPDGKECNEWTEWVNEVSAGGRDKGPAFISLRSLLAGLVPCLSPRVSSLRSATRYARDRFAPVCDANGMSEERRERVRSGQRRGEHTSLTDSRLNWTRLTVIPRLCSSPIVHNPRSSSVP